MGHYCTDPWRIDQDVEGPNIPNPFPNKNSAPCLNILNKSISRGTPHYFTPCLWLFLLVDPMPENLSKNDHSANHAYANRQNCNNSTPAASLSKEHHHEQVPRQKLITPKEIKKAVIQISIARMLYGVCASSQ